MPVVHTVQARRPTGQRALDTIEPRGTHVPMEDVGFISLGGSGKVHLSVGLGDDVAERLAAVVGDFALCRCEGEGRVWLGRVV